MKPDKFYHDAQTVAKFIQIYCQDKHDTEKTTLPYKLCYQGKEFMPMHIKLCDICHKTLSYSLARLEACPHEEKPSCRKCPAPCYEKTEWKLLAKIMRYSGMKLGLVKIRNLFKKS
ncbi:MAG: nitrous oxide-stimulated promoter family protein [Campylobacteraceae bacterium]|nr:nitrous oxide-stimulated promoter family protein [Campylobacteraceae bacterium]